MKKILLPVLVLIPCMMAPRPTFGFPSLGDIGGVTTGKVGRQISAGADLVKAATLDDKDVARTAAQYAAYSDKQNRIAPAGGPYAERLSKLTSGHTKEDGLKLNFKVYEEPEVNAFSLADGTIRIHSGLLDTMNDDEALCIIGHEIGHVKLGHSKARLRTALLASAARKSASTAGGLAGQLTSSELGALGEELVNAQFSQSDERGADDYGLKFMKRHAYNQQGCVTALQKLAELGGESSIFSTHPASSDRAARLQSQIKK
jgi:putative metalloprotease